MKTSKGCLSSVKQDELITVGLWTHCRDPPFVTPEQCWRHMQLLRQSFRRGRDFPGHCPCWCETSASGFFTLLRKEKRKKIKV